MPRRVSLPGAAELFRSTPAPRPEPIDRAAEREPAETRSTPAETVDHLARESGDQATGRTNATEPKPDQATPTNADAAVDSGSGSRGESGPESRTDSGRESGTGRRGRAPRGSGRVRHDEKITVYISSDELLDLERARLTLRAEHGMAVDRGRIVREALALAIGDLTERGVDSDLVRRLSQP